MRSFLRLLETIILLTGTKVTCEFAPSLEYVPLIVKIREYYQASTVFILHHEDLYNDYGDLPMAYVAHTWSRMLSRMGIVTLDVHFRRMHRTKRYIGNTVRPLFIVIIRNEEAFYKFSAATKNFQMSFPAWFVLFAVPPEKGKQDHCHHPVGNPFNVNLSVEMLVLCPDDNILREWYTIDGENMEISELAIWKKGLASPFVPLTNRSLFERRRNLKGLTLHCVYAKNSPFFKVVNGKPTGMLGRIMRELMKVLNFTLSIRAASQYGILMSNGSWDGAIGELVANRAEIGTTEFSMTASRMTAVEYLKPLLTSKNRIYFKQPDTIAVQWFAYFKTFSFWVWSCIIAVILFATILVLIIHGFSESTETSQLVSDSFLSVWGIFCQQGLPELPKETSLRVAYVTTFIVAVVVSAAYSAALICFLTASTRLLPFHTFDEFVHDGHYRLTVVPSTADYELLSQSKAWRARGAKSLIMPEKLLPKNMKEAFVQICSNPKLVYFSSQDKVAAMAESIPCQLSSVDAGRIDSLSMVLPKESPYTGILNHNILKFMLNGMIHRLKGTKLDMRDDKDVIFNPVGINNVAPVLTILCFGIGFGLIILIIEKCYFSMDEEIPVRMGIR